MENPFTYIVQVFWREVENTYFEEHQSAVASAEETILEESNVAKL